MTDSIRSSPTGATYLLRRAKSAVPAFRYKSAAPFSETQLKRQPTVVLYVDENCPLHGTQGKCICLSHSTNEGGLESTDSFDKNAAVDEQQIYDNYGNTNDLVSTNIKPFNNNPQLPDTQKNIVGNNFYFNPSLQSNGWSNGDDQQLGSLMIYRDALKQNLTTPYKAGGGFPKMRLGRGGGLWRHIKQTNTYSGSNLAFVDGTVRVDDTFKYPIPRFGYPPMTPSHQVSATSSYQNLSYPTSNPISYPTANSISYPTENPISYPTANPRVKSANPMTWSATAQLNRRASLSQYSNRFERHAKEGFAYWPTDIEYKKPRCKPATTGTYKTWLGLSDSILKL